MVWPVIGTKALLTIGIGAGSLIGTATTVGLYETGIKRPGAGSLFAPLLLAGFVARELRWI